MAGESSTSSPRAALERLLPELDLQGSANTAWGLASALLADSRTLSATDELLCRHIVPAPCGPLEKTAGHLNHVCQLIWAFSFVSCLAQSLGQQLRHVLSTTGEILDERFGTAFPCEGPGSSSANRLLGVGSRLDDETHQMPWTPRQPTLLMRLRGISVVFKPPYWEVDAKGQLSGSGLYLSHYMTSCHPDSVVLQTAVFEYGFVHRLDVPSSGLVLAGTTFKGLAALQWQMHTYSICRLPSFAEPCWLPAEMPRVLPPPFPLRPRVCCASC